MKRYSIIPSFCVLVTLSWCMISCDGFLKESPRDALPEEEGYRNMTELYLTDVNNDVAKTAAQQNISKLLTQFYNYIGGNSDSQGLQGTGRGIYDLNTFTTDEAIMPTRGGDWYDGGFWQGLFLHKWGINNDAIQATWEYLYKVVMLSNKSLEQIESYALTHADAELPAYRAEVRALRAMYYYYLTDLFGSIPLVLSSKVASKDIVLSERENIFNFIFKELQETAPLLPAQFSNRSGNYYGRLTRPVAYFLLAKLALNAEIYMDNNWVDDTHPDGKTIFFDVDGNTFNAWQTVEFYCDQITALGYRLESDYAANFAVYNEGSVENIFTIPMNKTLYTNQMQYLFRSRHYNHAKALGLSGENGSSATIEALQTFGYETNEQDPRFDYCYYAGTVYDLKGNVVKLDDGTALVYEPWKVKLDLSDEPYEKTAGARMKKYEIDDKAMKDGKLMENDIVLFRYADVLLMKSEAKVRDGRNGDEELNQVRARVGAPERTATLDNLLAERQLELAWEGWRRQDLIRFGQFTRSYNSRPQLPNEESGYTIVFPIPEKIRQMNPEWEQHPGY